MYCVYDKSAEKIIENGFATRQVAKELRKNLNAEYYTVDQITEMRLTNGEFRYIVARDASHPNGMSTIDNYFVPSKKNAKEDVVEETPEEKKARKEAEKLEKQLKKELKASKKGKKND